MEINEPTDIEWHFNVKRPDYLLNQSLVAASDLGCLKKKTGFGYTNYLAIFESGLVSTFSPAQEVEKQIKFYAKRITKNPRILDLLSKDYAAAAQALKVLLGQKMLNDYRIADFSRFFKSYEIFITFRVLSRVLGYEPGLDPVLVKKAAKARYKFKVLWVSLKQDMEKLWGNIANKYHVSRSDVKSLTAEQLLQGIRMKDFSSFKNRAAVLTKTMVLLATSNRMEVYVGKKAELVTRKVSKIDVRHIKMVTGQAAFRGKVVGIVRIINDPKRVLIKHKFVLVSSMTTPAFVPLLQKAVAIVTDEGGLTCHAAIIAREMKIPCVIGTKLATKVFHDGDLVEVDAYKGIVKILKRV